jgi:phage baseplate assembly protein W
MTTPPPALAPRPRAFLGKGLAFPLAVDARGRLATASGEAKVEQSLWFLLSTALGERVMRPEIGCGAHDLLFEPASPATVTRVVDQVRRALVAQEPRIDVLDVAAETSDASPNILLIRIDYRLRENNAMTNLVYPFFIREGV